MSKRIQGVTIEIGGNTKKLSEALKSVNAEVKKTQKELTNINKLLKFNPGNTELLKQKHIALGNTIKSTKDRLEELKKLEQELAKDPGQKEKWRLVKREIVDTEQSLKTLKQQQKDLKFYETEQGIKKVNFNLENTKKELDKVNATLKESPRNVELIKQKQELLKRSVTETSDKLQKLKQYEQELAKDPGQKDKWRGVQREIVETEKNLQSLKKEYKSVSSVKLEQVKASFQQAGEKAEYLANKTRGISTAAGIASAGSAKAAISFESAFAGVRKTVNATEAEFKELETGIRNMAKEIPVGANELSKIGEVAGQLGVKKESLLEFTRVVADLGVTTNLSSEEAATSLSQFMNIMGTSQEKISNLGSSVVDLGNNFATNERAIVNMSQRLAGMGKQVGMSEADVLGLATSMSSLGIEAEAGGSAMTQVMNKIQNAVFDGKEKLEDFARAAGVSADEFSKAFKERPTEALQQLLQGLNKTNQEGGNVNAVLETLGITGLREADAVKRLSGALDGDSGLGKALQVANKAFKENTALQKEAEQRYKTTESTLIILKNNLIDLGVSIGAVLAPAIQKISEKIKSAVNWFNSLSEGTKKVIAYTTIFVASLAPMFLAFSKLFKTITTVISGVKNLITVMGGIKKAFTLLRAVFLTNPFGLILTGLGLLVVAFIKAYNKSETFRKFVDKACNSAKEAVKNAYNIIKPIFDKMKIAWEIIAQAWSVGVEKVKAIFKATWDYVKQVWDVFWAILEPIITTAWEGIKTGFQNLWTAIQAIWDIFAGTFTGNWSRVWEGVKNLVSSIWDAIKNIFETILNIIWQIVSSIIQKIYNFISEIFTKIYNFISETWNNIYYTISDWVQKAWNTIKETVSGILNSVSEYFGQIPGVIRNLWSEAVNYLASINLFQTGWDIIAGLTNGVISAGSWLWEKAKSIAYGVIDSIKSVLGINSPSRVMTEFGEWTGEGLGLGIAAKIDDVKKISKKMSDSVIEAMKIDDVKDSFNSNLDMNYELSQSSSVVSTLNKVIDKFNDLSQNMNITVVSELNGREIARGTYRDIDQLSGLNYKKMKGVYS